MKKLWDLLQDTARGSQVVNAPEAAAREGDVPLLHQLQHVHLLLWALSPEVKRPVLPLVMMVWYCTTYKVETSPVSK